MKFSKLFSVFKGEGYSSAETFVSLVAFCAFLKSKDARIKSSSVKRALQSYSGGIVNVRGYEAIPVRSVLRYCFHNSDSSEACKYLTSLVQAELLGENEHNSSSLELYKVIAKTQFYNNSPFPFGDLQVEESSIPTLITEHKCHFTTEEWAKVCLFEKHFSKTVDFLSVDYEEVINLKLSKFQSILSFKQYGQNLLKIASADVKERSRRITASQDINRVEISAYQKHVPFILDDEILLLFQRYCEENVQSVTSFDTCSSKENNTIQIVVEVTTSDLGQNISDLCKTVYYYVARKHNVHVEEISFITSKDVNPFMNGQMCARFQLRDEIETKRLQRFVSVWKARDEVDLDELDSPESGNCDTCFNSGAVKPLSLKEFDIFHEWFMEIPMEFQLLLEVFINKKSLLKTSDTEKFLVQKFEKLFSVYDNLLNIFNRNFIGIFQEANTNEMLVEYRSVKSVFDITASTGTTTSLKYADKALKKKADTDLCYYQTYLKEHPLTYKTHAGQRKDAVSLRDCHIILMMDNLVRFNSTDNPNPWEDNTTQLCTLPITLQGLPTDSSVTCEWHLPECDGSVNCVCKQQVSLGKADVQRTLLSLNPDESHQHTQFFRMLTWSNTLMWKNLPGIYIHILKNKICINKVKNRLANDKWPSFRLDKHSHQHTKVASILASLYKST